MARAVSLFFRIAVLGLSVAAAVVMATANQVFPWNYGGVSYTKYSAFLYFVIATVVSAVCAAAALYLSVFQCTPHWVVGILDVVTMGLLFSAAGAVFAVRRMAPLYFGVAGADNNAAGRWLNGEFCHVAGPFCWRVTMSAIICAFAAGAISIAVLTRDCSRHNRGKH
uniref:CASP-like protein n=1 Tax=Leersia perrieri TaxID=77586 RepID=A0A0D9XUT4_9ORYZ